MSKVFNIKELRLLIFSFMIKKKNIKKKKINCVAKIINKLTDKLLLYIYLNHFITR